MSAYNAEEYLNEAIVSILDQSFTDFEFIIIDDGSTDKTNDIIQSFAHTDHRVKVISQKNKGLVSSLNSGFIRARGRYIARMDADDISLRDRLLRQYVYMESHPRVVVLGTQSAFMNESGQVYAVEPYLLDDKEIRTEILLRNRQFRHGAVMIRRTVVSQSGELYDPNAEHYEDFEYWPRLLRHGKGANLPEVLYLYRQSPVSLTATKKPEMREGTDRVILREQAATILSDFRLRHAIMAYNRAKIYKPARVIIKGSQYRTSLEWQYQSYIFALSKLYAKRSKYASATVVLFVCFCINPLRFGYGIVDVMFRSAARFFTFLPLRQE